MATTTRQEADADFDAFIHKHKDAPLTVSAFGSVWNTLVNHMRKKSEASAARIDALELRLAALDSDNAKWQRSSVQTSGLESRVRALEDQPRMEYLGVHAVGRRYEKNAAVTHGGNLWIAKEATTASPGDEVTPSRAWQLAVRKGRDAR